MDISYFKYKDTLEASQPQYMHLMIVSQSHISLSRQ